ncbi:uncharacterized protein Z518_05675 [Rhinocladiella mackenziei CBS 650.93]|uniref:Uncharacterized protein n=1 Tax=Rhinocladiella mackenziei CBS 650.93 TaxID=1442369 RepID=A0A0D2IG88_9EURO|nr:uncharacterized protein Z518_05675 [Rhinocladiella mackenziei CBS 650.93]KIX04804.1 hypothetical protein Z518_05675 [Rhinocladiella mackenziei CBS 650.93]
MVLAKESFPSSIPPSDYRDRESPESETSQEYENDLPLRGQNSWSIDPELCAEARSREVENAAVDFLILYKEKDPMYLPSSWVVSNEARSPFVPSWQFPPMSLDMTEE